jgi:putative NADPH-quinone reductase
MNADAAHAVLVSAHPCADSFTCAVAEAAARGLKSSGHEVTHLDLYALDFAAAMTRAEHDAYRARQAPPNEMVREHGELVRRAALLVFVYPTWWSGPPAVLKGWLERVLVPGVAFTFDDDGRVRPALTNVKRIVGISTYGSPWTYVKLMNDNGRRMLTRALRMVCGRRTGTTWLGLYSVDTLGANERAAFLDRVEHSMAHLHHR